MELINRFKQSREKSYNKSIEEEANSLYTIKVFDNQMVFALNGIPIQEIQPEDTAKDIFQKLKDYKQKYINYRKMNSNNSYGIS